MNLAANEIGTQNRRRLNRLIHPESSTPEEEEKEEEEEEEEGTDAIVKGLRKISPPNVKLGESVGRLLLGYTLTHPHTQTHTHTHTHTHTDMGD